MYQLQQIFNLIDIFTPQPKINFYTSLFNNLDLSIIPEYPSSKFGPTGYSRHALFRAIIVMKSEKFAEVSDLVDYLQNNLVIAHLCGFDITKKLPSYWTFERFLKNFDHKYLSLVMQNQVNILKDLGIISLKSVSMDSTPVKANSKLNNPKSFSKNKFSKDNHPKSDKDCKLGVHTASNDFSNKNYEFYWGYKNHIIIDSLSGLPIAEVTTTADTPDFEVAIPLLSETNSWFSLEGIKFIADKGYDVKKVYNFVRDTLHGYCFIPLNKRRSKKHNLTIDGHVICDAGLPMIKDGKEYFSNYVKQKHRCKFYNSKDDSLCPCHHPKYFNGKKHRGCIKYTSVSTDYRSTINRDSIYFKSIYKLRTESERYNSRWKALNLERAFVRNINSVSNINTFGHITLLTLSIAAYKENNIDKTKSLDGLKRSA